MPYYFMTKMAEKEDTLRDHTYLYNQYKGVELPPLQSTYMAG